MALLSPTSDRSLERRVMAAVRLRGTAGPVPSGLPDLGMVAEAVTDLLKAVGEPPLAERTDPSRASPAPLLQPLLALLWAHRASDHDWTRLMAGAIACACFGEHHLWQDLGLAGRGEVSTLLARHFPGLAVGNTRGLRWKRYLFLRLGDELGVQDLAPPRCDGCEDFQGCFPSERPPSTLKIRHPVPPVSAAINPHTPGKP